MPDFVANCAGISVTTGTGNYVITSGTDKHRRIDQTLTDGQEVAYYITPRESDMPGYETGVAIWRSATSTLEVQSVETSSNFNTKVNWLSGEKVVYITASTLMLTGLGGSTTVDTVADMVAFTGADIGDYIQVQSYTATNNSGILTFVAVALGTGTADGGSYINGVGVQWKQIFGGEINAKSFGIGGGTDELDHTRWNACIDYVQTTLGGGIIRFSGTSVIYGNIVLKKSVTIKGDLEFPAGWVLEDSTLGTVIECDGTASIVTKTGSVLDGVCVKKFGVDYPQTALQATSWTGTGVTGDGSGSAIINCMIAGFATGVSWGVSTEGASRCTLNTVFIDCIAGVVIEDSVDMDRLTDVHIWPFMGGTDGARTGDGIKITGRLSWSRIQGCFVIGHTVGIHLVGTEDVSIDNCGLDGTSGLGQIGILIDGDAVNTKIMNTNFGGTYEVGDKVDCSASALRNSVIISGCSLAGGAALKQVEILRAGTVLLVDSMLIEGAVGLEFGSDNSIRTVVTGCHFRGQTSAPVKNADTGYTTNVLTWDDNSNSITGTFSGDIWTNAVDQAKNVAAGATTYLQPNYPFIRITGGGTINGFTKQPAGRRVTVEFGSATTISNSGNAKTTTGASKAFSAGDRATFVSTGFYWYET